VQDPQDFTTFESLGPSPHWDGSEKILVGYSAKNRNFDNNWFQSLRNIKPRLYSSLRVLIVDTPYAFNSAAEHGRDTPVEAEIERMRKVGNERERMVRRILKGSAIEITRWWWYADFPIVHELRKEIISALEKRKIVFRVLDSYASKWFEKPTQNPQFLNFLVQEIPVFAYLYWVEGFSIDIYPGRPLNIFVNIQEGSLKSELPTFTELASTKAVSFIDTSKSLFEV